MSIGSNRQGGGENSLGRSAWAGLLLTFLIPIANASDIAPVDEAVVAPTTKTGVEQSFIQFVENDGGSQLQTSISYYSREDGVQVDLIGAVHLADPLYYQKLNEAFGAYEAVLFELIVHSSIPGEERFPSTAKVSAKGDSPMAMSILTGTQSMLTRLLQLEHQVNAIDYSAENMVHADLTWNEFRTLQEVHGETFLTLLQKGIEAERNNPEPSPPVSIPGLFAAVVAGETTLLKESLARQIERAESISQLLEKSGPTVILAERNRIALERLSDQVEAGRTKLAIFYGAGHLFDLEERLFAQGFSRTGRDWLTAWDIPRPLPEAAESQQDRASGD